jgi:hypothetical protein
MYSPYQQIDARIQMRIAVALLASIAGLLLGIGMTSPAKAAAQPTAELVGDEPPTFAYYYIWFDPSSWNRAKTDYPLLGRYSSDERRTMLRHVRLAKRVGIDGFIVSWKSTPALDARLATLSRIADRLDFKLIVIYQGLDFERRPLPVEQVGSDFEFFERRFGDDPVFNFFGSPVIIWSGTWEFSAADIGRVTSGRKELKVLASAKDVDDYRRVAALVDGNAYYWSSVNPDTFPGYEEKLVEMGEAVHADGGLWIAPAAPGFDARMIGGTTVVKRKGGETLRREYAAAVGSAPDAVGIISWNEFSENSQIEPSENFGTESLEVVADLNGAKVPVLGDFDSSAPAARSESGFRSLAGIVAIVLIIGGGTTLLSRRRGAAQRTGPP